ncbi:MAG TPA: protein kinase [Candidatus Saccharimonadales bacterium]|nr:protein kinase [Candidatus Saccharimonadales bacterium]
MNWPPGTRLGPYEITGPLGAGGMGEVHRARDTRLDREVAIKAIPAAMAGQEQLRLRLEREAKAISSLNHPHICTLYDVGHAPVEGRPGESGEAHFLVMELLDGESLADRLQKGPLPLHDVLRYGRQIASALDAAHRRGIIHRDLKPGNVMITKTGAKLLDFGLARTATGEPAALSDVGSASSKLPTAMAADAQPLTAEGTILGTFQYMAPEQLEGAEADARTDIFAFGALLYEMATGMRAFRGTSKASLIAAIVSAQPAPISSVTPMTPPSLDHVVRRCLEKDPDDRWQSAHDVAGELQWISEAGSQAGVAAPITIRRKTRERLAWGLAAVLAVATVALGAAFLLAPREVPRALRATIEPPPDQTLVPFDQFGLALSPDGRSLAFVAMGADGKRRIWVRELSSMSARAIPETEGGWYPFWSPDGQSLGFFSGAKLKAVDLRGGSPRVLADAPSGRGGTWSREGVILFAPNITSEIDKVPAEGGSVEPVTKLDLQSETTHRWPVFLPDGKHFVFVSRGKKGGQIEVGRLMLGSLDSPETSVLIDDSSNALYVEPGYLIYGRSANLYARRFDARSLSLPGEPVLIVKEKLSYWEAKNFVPFAASDSGALVYLPETTRTSQMRWYDPQGRPLETLGSPGYYDNPRISPDGRKIAFVQAESSQSLSDIWIRDLEFDRTFRLTQQSGVYGGPVWAPDSDRIAFVCQPKGISDICVTSVSGGGEIQVLRESDTWKSTGSWLPDGSGFLFGRQDPATNFDIMLLPAGGKGEPEPLVHTPFEENSAQCSPDGQRMAYTSNQTGRIEVYVRSLKGAGQWQISTDGGQQPRWRADGKELFYAATDGSLMSVPIQTVPVFRPGTPVRLFALPARPDIRASDLLAPIFEDVTPDGKRFLLNVPTTSLSGVSFHAVFNWTALIDGTPK